MTEREEMQGYLTLLVTDEDGQVLMRICRKNRIVKTGRLLVAQLFAGVSGGSPPTQVTHMAVGTDNTVASDDQTQLGAEVARNAITDVSFTEFDDTSTGTAVRRVKATLKAIFDFAEANAAKPLQEAGIFTAAANGVMYNRVVFDPVTKTQAFKLTMMWDITF
jgi:hypothetical protein